MTKQKNKNFFFQAFLIVFKDPFYIGLTLSLTLNLLALYYFLLYRITTLEVFLASNSAFYNWFSIVSTILISLFFGIAVSFLVWQWKQQKQKKAVQTGNTFLASFFGAISTGCPVCGALVASLLGIGGGLAAFPFQGLEIKAISLGLLSFAIFSSTKAVSNKDCLDCKPVTKKTLKSLAPAIIGIALLVLVISLPVLADKFNFRVSFQPNSQITAVFPNDSSNLLEEINPSEGYTINTTYGDIGPKLLAAGAIDFEKMKSLYENNGQPLTQEQIEILTEGSNEKIKITSDNAYFLLNLFWAFGLANKNIILDEGPMMKYGEDQIGRFASTGGWTLGTKESTELYSGTVIVSLNSEQQSALEDFAYNSYRPCCSNPTGFPDCNHGMAALGLAEIMAAQGASVEEMFEAFKYVNGFWFPQTYFDIANYFQAKEGKAWSEVDNRLVAGKDYSTPQGWERARNWLKSNNLIEEAPDGGGGCGV